MSLFNNIKIQTPESVELEFTLAGVGGRAVALTIDYMLLGIALLVTFWLGLFVFSQLSQWESLLYVDTDTLQLWAIAILSVCLFFLYVGYFIGFETWWYGQTPGKRYAKIQVIRDDAQPVRLFQATLRALLRPVDDILFVGFFFILLSQREKRIGDWLAGTLVVQVGPRAQSDEIMVVETAKSVSADLPSVMDFDAISPDDFATIREYLRRRKMMTTEASKAVSIRLARQIEEKTKLASLPKNMEPETFLEAVYWGYQQRK